MGRMYILLAVATLLASSHAWRISTSWPSSAIVQNELVSELEGDVILPSDGPYYQWILSRNLDFIQRPGAIAMVANTADVQKCILFARKYKLRVTIRSAGHSYIGRSTADGSLQIHLVAMNNIRVNANDPRSDTGASADVQAGTQWASVYEEVSQYNLLAVGSSIHSESVGGFLVGGGHSPLTRQFGLGVDNVFTFTIVLANGDVAKASVRETEITKVDGDREVLTNGDLFWAVRGGGAAYGVVTEFKLKLHPQPRQLVHLLMFLPIRVPGRGNPAAEFLRFYGDFAAKDLTEKWGGYLLVDNIPAPLDMNNTRFSGGTLTLSLLHLGDHREAVQSIQPLLNWRPDIGRMLILTNHTSFWHYQRNVTDRAYVYSYFISRLLGEADVASPELTTLLTEDLLEQAPGAGCTAAHVGGRSASVPEEGASVNPQLRRALWDISCGFSWPSPSGQGLVMNAVRSFRDNLYRLGDGVYYNEPDYNLENWQEEYWGGNYARLQGIKEIWDPENFFSCHMCVSVETAQSDVKCESSCVPMVTSKSNMTCQSRCVTMDTVQSGVKCESRCVPMETTQSKVTCGSHTMLPNILIILITLIICQF